MTSFKSILRDIYNASLSVKNQDSVDRTITGAITYQVVMNAITPTQQSTSYLAQIYYKNIYNNIQSIKYTNISYQMMVYYIKRINKSLLNLTQKEIQSINNLYADKSVIPPYNPSYFTPEMYSISPLKYPDTSFLEYVHIRVMKPISEYYINMCQLPPCNMRILDALGDSSIPGKQIYFNIDGVPAPKVMVDIQYKITSVLQYIDDISLDGNAIILTMK